ncbi:CfrBI family restriction endonuclease [Candidatus Palauibacter sp.]|uniref:CfrBI family restriction endonuclease n=1 Tax=Candidatus Palauibacter sp. TaxID=3101350 RepID=UPI003CC5E835
MFFEDVTRRRLIDAYVELAEIARRHPTDDDSWRSEVKALIRDGSGQAPLRYWLIGLARKTAQNMGLRVADYPVVFDQMVDEIREMPANLAMRETVLLMWAGAATLTIRGSQKARIGKALEKAIARAALTIIGLSEAEEAFRLNIRADREVERETDAEVYTRRGAVRIEVGLIGVGNSEVIGDKINRIGPHGALLFDILPEQSNVWGSAETAQVKLIQMRHCHPVEELRCHLLGLEVQVRPEPLTPEDVEARISDLPLAVFSGLQGDAP